MPIQEILRRDRKALRFDSRDHLLEALGALEVLGESEDVKYNIVPGTFIVVIPSRLAPKAKKCFAAHELPFEEVKIRPLNTLPPEEQARRRGLLRHKRD